MPIFNIFKCAETIEESAPLGLLDSVYNSFILIFFDFFLISLLLFWLMEGFLNRVLQSS